MIRSFYITICFLILGCFSAAQSTDSLIARLDAKGLTEIERIDIMNVVARNLSYIDAFRSIEFARRALESSGKIKYKQGMAYANRNLAGAYSYFGSFYLTMEKLSVAIELFDELKDSAGIASCYISLGHVYHRLHNHKEELRNHQLAYEIFVRIGDPERIGVTANNLAEAYLTNEMYEQSLQLARKAVWINDSLRNKPVLSSVYRIMGKVFLAEQEVDSAVYYFRKALAISEELGAGSQKIATVESLVELATSYDKQGRHEDELVVLIKAAEFVKENRMTDYVEDVYIKLIREYVIRNQEAKALDVITEYRATKDSLDKKQLEDRGKLTQGFMQMYALEKKNNALAAENKLQEQRIRGRNRIVVIVTAFSFLLLVLLLLFLRNIRRLRKVNEALVEQEFVIRVQNKKLEELNTTKDKFFSIVSHDIKAPLNSLWSFSRILEDQINMLDRDKLLLLSKELNQQVESTTKMVENLITWAKIQMRDFSIHPVDVSPEALIVEVIKIYEEIAAAKNVRVKFNPLPGTSVRADRDHLLFIVRNLVNNAIKYSKPGGVVEVVVEKNVMQQVKITVKDQGAGISEQTRQQITTGQPVNSKQGTAGEYGTGMGLKLCVEFARLNAGEILIDSNAGTGSAISVLLPAGIGA